MKMENPIPSLRELCINETTMDKSLPLDTHHLNNDSSNRNIEINASPPKPPPLASIPQSPTTVSPSNIIVPTITPGLQPPSPPSIDVLPPPSRSPMKFLNSQTAASPHKIQAGRFSITGIDAVGKLSSRSSMASSIGTGVNIVATEIREDPLRLGHSVPSEDYSKSVFNLFNGKKHFTVYKILVKFSGQKWTIFKRYSEFCDLDKILRKQFSYLHKSLVTLPPKKIFGDNMDPQFVQERAKSLHQYVQGLFASPVILRSEAVRTFLCGEHSMNTNISDDGITDTNSSDCEKSSEKKRKPDVVFSTPDSFLTKSALKKRGSLRKTLKKVAWRKTVFEVKSIGADTSRDSSNGHSLSCSSDFSGASAESSKSVSMDDFYLLKLIGKGNFGKVMLAQHKDSHRVYAIKVISKASVKKKSQKKDVSKLVSGSPHDFDHIMAERNVLIRSVNHPFLIGLRWAFQSKEKLYFVTDYVNGGELFFHLQKEHRFSELRARFYTAEILCALAYLHVECDVVYRDLKPENILLDSEGHIKLTDFGLAKENFYERNSGKTQTFCGTPEYLAPEVIRKEPYGFPVDWWCLGSVLYEMLIGLPPFYSKNTKEMYEKILHEKIKFPPYVGIRARSLISGLLHRSPYFRLGTGPNNASNPQAIKQHPFFEGMDWEKLLRKEYKPPFVPVVSHLYDLRNIDPQFVNEPIPQSIIADGLLTQEASTIEVEVSEVTSRQPIGATFKGFTFIGDESPIAHATD